MYNENEIKNDPQSFKSQMWCASTHRQLSNRLSILKEMVHS